MKSIQTKAKKALIMALAFASFATVFSGCGKDTPAETQSAEETVPEESPEVTQETTPEVTEAPAPSENTETSAPAAGEKGDFGPLSDDPYSFQIEINGEVYQFPMPYEQFAAYGWVYKDDSTTMLDAHYVAGTSVFNLGDLQCYADIVNFDINQRPLNECYIGGISFDTFQVEKGNASILLPGGLQFGVATVEDAKNKYGTASDEITTDSGSVTLYYRLDYDRELRLRFDESSKTMANINIENYIIPDDFQSGEVSSEVPAIVSKYQAPTAISENFADWTAEYGGKLYQLPAPITEFLADGWSIVPENSEETIQGRGHGWVTMMKDNQQLRVIAQNYSEGATSINNCFITDLVSDEHDSKTPITIAKGIALGMTQADLESAIAGEEIKKEDSSSYSYYKIMPTGKLTESYEFYVKKETGLVYKIKMSYSPRYADYTGE